ncbi:polyprenyl synthetase family protein [Candidatus Daviesbacteria bacterium]|nr:polyprenyl synthetase family protein [Candidatus Daviesbacteria bacterium]
MDFRKYLEKYARQLNEEVDKILQQQINKASETDQKLVPLLKAFAKVCQGGKRIRGALVGLGYQLAGGQSKEIIKIGAALEIVHAGVLVHDDIIDQSLLRRNQPSLHQALGGDHYGVSQAISLADYSFFLGVQIISEANFPQDFKLKALKLFSEVMKETAWGEMLDLEETDPFIIMKLKTARYTIAGPFMIGAILAGAESELLKRLEEFGENLGVAFQIQDDILDSEIDYLGDLTTARAKANEYKIRALKVLTAVTKEEKMSKILQQLAVYLVERDK